MDPAGEITRLLRACGAGERGAFERLIPLVYDEMRRLARAHLRRFPAGRTLDTTGLVHEGYLKLARSPGERWNDRGHLLAVAACAMRQVLMSRARARLRAKRGGGERAQALDEGFVGHGRDAERLLDLDRALRGLRVHDRTLARVFECRYFAGLSEAETAEALRLSLRTVQRSWSRARAWLRAALESGPGAGG